MDARAGRFACYGRVLVAAGLSDLDIGQDEVGVADGEDLAQEGT